MQPVLPSVLYAGSSAHALMVQRRFVCISSEAPQKNITSAVAKFVFARRPNCRCSLGEKAARSLAGRNITRKPRVSVALRSIGRRDHVIIHFAGAAVTTLVP